MKLIAHAAVLLMSATTSAFASDFSVSARSGTATKAFVYTNWNDDCSSLIGEVRVIDQPQHGTIKSSTVPSRIGESRSRPGRTPHCTGKPTDGLMVTYQSQPGFKGRDEFKLDVIYSGRNRWTDRFSVTVR